MSGSPDVSLVLVAHHSADVLPEALAAFRRECAGRALAGEVVVVEQSEDAEQTKRVASSAPDELLERPNRGYAAGVNAGLRAARGAVVLAGNPDVTLAPGSLGALLGALDEGFGVVGPQFELAGALFPPAELQNPRAEVSRRRAGRSRHAWERHLRRELRRSLAVWEAPGPVAVEGLSGALLAFRAELARRVGPWDEDYFLYFEETDWLRRARRAGLRLGVVPSACARHRWGHSARPEASGELFDRSRRRYYGRTFPGLGPLALRVPVAPPPRPVEWPGAGGEAWKWLLSPAPAGFPAAAVPEGRAPDDVAAGFCRAVGRDELTLVGWRDLGRELRGPYRWRAAGSSGVDGTR